MTLPTFRGVYKPSTLGNYSQRVVEDPPVIAAVHMTGNRDTASLPVGIDVGQGTYQEWLYAAHNAQSKDGPSAHRYEIAAPRVLPVDTRNDTLEP